MRNDQNNRRNGEKEKEGMIKETGPISVHFFLVLLDLIGVEQTGFSTVALLLVLLPLYKKKTFY